MERGHKSMTDSSKKVRRGLDLLERIGSLRGDIPERLRMGVLDCGQPLTLYKSTKQYKLNLRPEWFQLLPCPSS